MFFEETFKNNNGKLIVLSSYVILDITNCAFGRSCAISSEGSESFYSFRNMMKKMKVDSVHIVCDLGFQVHMPSI